jgi:hypothetical protein
MDKTRGPRERSLVSWEDRRNLPRVASLIFVNLERLKNRGLGTKRSLALREFALGLEALERFVHKEPLRRVHECGFGVLALESEPVDPRL